MQPHTLKFILLFSLISLPFILTASFTTSFPIKDFSAQHISTSWYLYSVSFLGNFTIIDVTNLADPISISSISTVAHPYRIVSDGNIAYILETSNSEQLIPLLDNYYTDNTLTIIDVSEKDSPEIIQSFSIPTYATSLSLANNLLFISVQNSILIYDTDYMTLNYTITASNGQVASSFVNPLVTYLFLGSGALTGYLITTYPVTSSYVIANPYYSYRDITVQDGIFFAGTTSQYIRSYVSAGVCLSGGTWINYGNSFQINRFNVNFNNNANYISATFKNTPIVLVFNDISTSNTTYTSKVAMDTTFYNGGDYILGTVVGGNMYVLDISPTSTSTTSTTSTISRNIIGIIIGIAMVFFRAI